MRQWRAETQRAGWDAKQAVDVGFVSTAAEARAAGFDVLQVHMAGLAKDAKDAHRAGYTCAECKGAYLGPPPPARLWALG